MSTETPTVSRFTRLKAAVYSASVITWLTASAFNGILLLGFPCAVLVYPFSRKLYYKVMTVIFGTFYVACLSICEVLPGIRVHVHGELPVADENVLIISNHKSNVDYMYVWSLMARADVDRASALIGAYRAVAKRQLRNLWFWSTGFKFMGFCFLSRKWEDDQDHIKAWAAAIKKDRLPCQVSLYPEGTRYTDAKKPGSDKFAESKGVAPYESELLFPRTKGLVLLYDLMHDYFESVLDVTMAYTKDGELLRGEELGTGALVSVLQGNIMSRSITDVHIHVRRTTIFDMPTEPEALTKWCLYSWEKKDKLLTTLKATGSFPGRELEVAGKLGLKALRCALLFTTLNIYSALIFYYYTRVVTWYAVISLVLEQIFVMYDDPRW